MSQLDPYSQKVLFQAAARFKQLMPSFTDPSHYSDHNDKKLVAELESIAKGRDPQLDRLVERIILQLRHYPDEQVEGPGAEDIIYDNILRWVKEEWQG